MTVPLKRSGRGCGDFPHNRPAHSSLGMYAASNLLAAKNALKETPVEA